MKNTKTKTDVKIMNKAVKMLKSSELIILRITNA
jgi:hypothetical protein